MRLTRLFVAALLLLLFVPMRTDAAQVHLAWNASSDPWAAGYFVCYGTTSGAASGCTGTRVFVGTATSYTVSSLSPSTTYFFAVFTYSPFGEVSVASNVVSLSTVNQVPSVTNPGSTTRRQGAFTIAISASDPDGGSLTYSATGLPTGTTIGAATGVITGSISSPAGVYSVTVTVSDGIASVQANFQLTVTANNSPTLAAVANQSNVLNDAIHLALIGSDPDSVDTVTYSASNLPPGLSLNTGSGVITGMLLEGSGGVHSVTVNATDGSLTASRSFTWTVTEAIGGLVSYWKMNENTGTTTADVVGGRTGTLSDGAAWLASAYADAGVTLNGTSAFVALPTFDVPGNAITITAWVRNSSLATNGQRFISKSTGTGESDHYWMLGLIDGGGGIQRLRFRLKTGGTTTTQIATTGTISTDTWYHAAATYDGINMRLYLNGVQVGIQAKSGALDTNASVPVSIGRSPEGSSFLQGAIDEVRIYNRGLSGTEVATIRNAAVQAPPVLTNPGNRTVSTGAFSLQIVASDPQGQALSYSATGLPAGVSINPSTGLISGTIAASVSAVRVTVTDGSSSAAASFTITASGTAAPVLGAPGNQTTGTNQSVSLQLSASDADGNTLTYSASNLPPGLTLNSSSGLITGAPVLASVGARTVTVSVTDGTFTTSQSFTWTVVRAFSNDPITAGSTAVRAVHITELRERIDALRNGRGLGSMSWTDPTLTAGASAIKSVHITELRSALNAVYVSRGLTPPVYTDPSLTSAVAIKAVHITQLRAAVVAVE